MTTNFKVFYDARARTYGPIDQAGIKRYEYALKIAPLADGHHIADIGCKTGSLLHLLNRRQLNCTYHGVDISAEALKLLPDHSDPNMTISVQDIMGGMPIKDHWADRVYCLEVIEHVREPMTVMEEIARILKDDGLAVVSVPNPYNWTIMIANLLRMPDTEGHLCSFTWQDMHRLCSFAGLTILKVSTTFDHLPYSLNKPYKRNKFITVKAWCSLLSRSNQYLVQRSKPE